jgi:hypothetical protein
MAARPTNSRLPTRRDEISAPKGSSRIPSRSAAPSPTSNVKSSGQSRSMFSRHRTVKGEPQQTTQAEAERASRSHAATPVLDLPISFEVKPSTASHFGFRSKAGSASSTDKPKEKPQRNVLRRKPSSNNQRSAYTHYGPLTDSTPSLTPSTAPSQLTSRSDQYSTSVIGYPLPSNSASPATGDSGAVLTRSRSGSTSNKHIEYPFGVPGDLTAYNLPAPTSIYPGPSSSPSTRHSESPGPWSRTSTPTSMSSHSPGITMPSKFNVKPRQQSPTRSRPPVTRRRAGSANNEEIVGPVDVQGLPSLRESVTSSSSSGSTLKGAEKLDKALADGQKKRRKKRLTPPHPSPPPRKSSQKFKKTLPIDTNQSLPSRYPDSAISGIERSPEDFNEKPIVGQGAPTFIGRPVRPSREGAPDLNGAVRSNISVVQSNLTNVQPGRPPRRGSSGNSVPNVAQTSNLSGRSQIGIGAGLRLVTSNMSSRNPSPSPSQTQSERSLPGSLGPSPDLKHPEMRKPRPMASSPQSASPGKSSTSRFGIFSRKPKVVLEQEPKAEKQPKKGPVAGTGHEGYGRHALRGRGASQSRERTRSNSGASAAGSVPHGPSSRKGSLSARNDREVDDFLLDRLDPVIISGGGGTPATSIYGAEMSRTGSNQSSAADRPSFESKISSSGLSTDSKRSNELAKPSFAFFGAARLTPSTNSGSSSRRPSTSSDQEETPRKPSLALRRSLHRSQLFSEKAPLSMPEPINTSGTFSSPSIGSQATTIYSGGPLIAESPADVSEGKEGNWLKPKKASKEGKSPRKWNFFQRAHNINQKTTTPMTEVSVTVTRHQPARPVAHYALLESADQIDTQNLNNYMQESQDTFQSPVEEEDASEAEAAELRRQQHARSILLPDPPAIPSGMQNIRPASPKITLRANEEVAQAAQVEDVEKPVEPAPSKRSRLPQVGRIPKVVSTRTAGSAPPSGQRAFPLISSISEEHDPSTSTSAGNVFLPERTLSPAPVSQNAAQSSVPYLPASLCPIMKRTTTEDSNQGSLDSNNFLTFPLRNGSVVSYSSSSGGQSNLVTTAIIPQPHTAPVEDEVWDEYDDFLDHVNTPDETSKPAASDFIFPLPQPGAASSSKSAHQQKPKEAPLFRPNDTNVPPVIRSPPTSPLRSSKFHSAATSLIPTTPLSLTDFFAGYGERNLSYHGSAGTRFSLSDAASRVSSASNYSRSQGEPLSTVRGQPRDSDRSPTIEKDDHGARSQINVRFGALMTSKWLSFGRVLFSPAHAEVTAPTAIGQHDRILILDGLGNGKS